MKAKHHGLLSITCILIAIGISIAYYATETWKITDISPDSKGFQALPLYPEPSPMEVKAMEQLSPKINTLINPPAMQQLPSDLRIIGFINPGAHRSDLRNNNRTTKHEKMDFQLSFTFSSGKKRFCILDNTFYREGELLPDSSRIMAIQARKVLLEKNGIQNWIDIDAQAIDQQGKTSE